MNILKVKRKHSGQTGRAVLLTRDLYDEPGQKILRSLIGETTDHQFIKHRTTGRYLVVGSTFQLLDPDYFEKKYEILSGRSPAPAPEAKPKKGLYNLKKKKK